VSAWGECDRIGDDARRVAGIQPVDSLIHFINGQPRMDDKQLYAQSLILEPRGAPPPK
jgi:hypothetical protein